MKGNEKLKTQASVLFPAKIQFHSYIVENRQKTMLNFYFKSRFSLKRAKFQIYFAKDCRNFTIFDSIRFSVSVSLILCLFYFS